jgi:hypothetical protein
MSVAPGLRRTRTRAHVTNGGAPVNDESRATSTAAERNEPERAQSGKSKSRDHEPP